VEKARNGEDPGDEHVSPQNTPIPETQATIRDEVSNAATTKTYILVIEASMIKKRTISLLNKEQK
jgi:hypothetical protein